MSHEHEDLFPVLEPPEGGLDRLRASVLALRRERMASRWMPAVLAPIGAAAVLAFFLGLGFVSGRLPILRHTGANVALAANPALVRFGLEPAPREAVSVLGGARDSVAALRVGADEIEFYWIAAR